MLSSSEPGLSCSDLDSIEEPEPTPQNGRFLEHIGKLCTILQWHCLTVGFKNKQKRRSSFHSIKFFILNAASEEPYVKERDDKFDSES